MSDLFLDPITHDIRITNGDLSIADEQDAIAQQLEIRLRFWFGEWFRNRSEGIDYLQYILVKNPDNSIITSLFSRVIRETPGVVSLDSFTLAYDNRLRKLSISFSCTCSTGQTITYTDFDLTRTQGSTAA